MPKKTYTQINSVTLATASSSVTFGSIPQNFRDLILSFAGTGTGGLTTPQVRFNGDSGSNYSLVRMYGNGSGTGSTATTLTYIPYFYSGSVVLGTSQQCGSLQIMDYSTSDKQTSCLFRGDNNSDGITEALAFRWANTSPISSIGITTGSGSISAGSTFTLYGIEA